MDTPKQQPASPLRSSSFAQLKAKLVLALAVAVCLSRSSPGLAVEGTGEKNSVSGTIMRECDESFHEKYGPRLVLEFDNGVVVPNDTYSSWDMRYPTAARSCRAARWR